MNWTKLAVLACLAVACRAPETGLYLAPALEARPPPSYATVREVIGRRWPPPVARYLAPMIYREAVAAGVSPALVVRVIWHESRGTWWAIGRPTIGCRGQPDQAIGLMQVMPSCWAGTWPGCGADLSHPRANVCVGVRVLRHHLEQSGTLADGLSAYCGAVTVPCPYVAELLGTLE